VLACASFAFRGHALEEPRLFLGLLITFHILALAFWVGAFVPLLRAARFIDPALAREIVHDFGEKALWVVGGLVIVGLLTLGILTHWRVSALLSPYGQFFVLKLVVFVVVLGLAGLNKLQFTPALWRGEPIRAGRMSK